MLGRAQEDFGRRDLAAPLLDRAANAAGPDILPVSEDTPLSVLALRYADAPADADTAVPYVRQLLAANQMGAAGEIAERVRGLAPGSADAQALAGDLRFAQGDLGGAVDRYRLSAAIRLSDSLLLRLVAAYVRAGQGGAAAGLVNGVLANSPRNPTALRLAAGFAAEAGDWQRAVKLLDYLARSSGGRDAKVLADLSLARMRSGDVVGSRTAAEAAYRLQRASAVTTQAWGMALAGKGGDASLARILLAKARKIGGDNPLLRESESRLASQ